MDVVTHGMMGVVIAAPFAPQHPEAAVAFMMGSVLPDTDVVTRVLGKRTFLKCHQTFTHALPIIVAVSVAVHFALSMLGIRDYRVAAGFGLGMILHSFLDYSNTYGITLLAPFSRKRYSREWLFFIDLPVIVVSVAALTVVCRSMLRDEIPGLWLAYSYAGFLMVYWILRIWLHRRAWRLSPQGTICLLPTAFTPWKFVGAGRQVDKVHLFDLNVIDGSLANESLQEIHDASFAKALEEIPEYRTMRGLSPLFHVVDVLRGEREVIVTCRDLRVRHFSTRFGELTVTLDPAGGVQRVHFHV